jgi:hypothetical protein
MKKAFLLAIASLLTTATLSARVHDGFKYAKFTTGMTKAAALRHIPAQNIIPTKTDNSIICFHDTLMAVPAKTTLRFDENGRLARVDITAGWNEIRKVYDPDSFIPKIKRRLTNKYRVEPYYQDYGQLGGIADAARVEWRINHHSAIWYASEPTVFRLVYEYRRWSNENDRDKL